MRFAHVNHILVASLNISDEGQGIMAGEVIYNPAIFCVKASILYLYHRVFSVSKKFTKTLWAVGIFTLYVLTQPIVVLL